MTRIADEIGAEFTLPRAAKGHIVAQDIHFRPIGHGDGVQRLMRFARGIIVGQFDILNLGAPDNRLLFRRRGLFPGFEVMQIFLHHDIAATCEIGILISNQRGRGQIGADRICSAIDKTQQIARVEIAKSDHLIDHLNAGAQLDQDQLFQLKAHILTGAADVKQQIARGCRGIMGRPLQGRERPQIARSMAGRHPVPSGAADPGDAGQIGGLIAKTDRLDQILDPIQHIDRLRQRRRIAADGHDKKDRRTGQRRVNGLRVHGWADALRCRHDRSSTDACNKSASTSRRRQAMREKTNHIQPIPAWRLSG